MNPIGPVGSRPPGDADPKDPRTVLRHAAHQFEGVFLAQLFKAMRSTVGQSGLVANSPGQEIFTSMLDDKLAGIAADHSKRGLGEALYHQLSRRLSAAKGPPSP